MSGQSTRRDRAALRAPLADTAPLVPERTRASRHRLVASTMPLWIAIVAVLGMSVMLYPAAATWFSSLGEANVAHAYSERIESIGPENREEVLGAAHEFNSQLSEGRILDPFTNDASAAESSEEHAEYERQLAADDHGTMARIRIPKINLDLPVVHGTSEQALAQGIGHLEGTSLPVGGEGTHAVLTGHRGLPNAELFTRLDEVAVDDTFTIEVFGDVLTYEVRDVSVVLPTETDALRVQDGKDLVTLVTCTPLGINTHRILVTAERIPTPPEAAADPDQAAQIDRPGFPWWAVWFGSGLAAVGAYIVFALRMRAHRRPPLQHVALPSKRTRDQAQGTSPPGSGSGAATGSGPRSGPGSAPGSAPHRPPRQGRTTPIRPARHLVPDD